MFIMQLKRGDERVVKKKWFKNIANFRKRKGGRDENFQMCDSRPAAAGVESEPLNRGYRRNADSSRHLQLYPKGNGQLSGATDSAEQFLADSQSSTAVSGIERHLSTNPSLWHKRSGIQLSDADHRPGPDYLSEDRRLAASGVESEPLNGGYIGLAGNGRHLRLYAKYKGQLSAAADCAERICHIRQVFFEHQPARHISHHATRRHAR